MIKGPDVHICNQYISICVGFLVDVGDDTIEKLMDRDAESASNLIRAVTLPEPYQRPGLAILGLFELFALHHAPALSIRTRIELKERTLRLVIDLREEDKNAVRKLLDEYGLAVQGKSEPDPLFADVGQAEFFRQQLAITALEIGAARGIVDCAGLGMVPDTIKEEAVRLHDALSWVLRREVEDVHELFEELPRDQA